MKWRKPTAVIFINIGIMSVMIAVVLLIAKQPTTFQNEQNHVLGVYDLTVPFRIAAGGLLVIGCGLFVAAWRALMKRD